MRWFERILLYIYLGFVTGWVYLLHQQGNIHHELLQFLFLYLESITGGKTV